MDFESFEWDQTKAQSNLRNHGVAFEEATRVFDDPFAIEWLDDREDYGEDRYLILGEVNGRILLIAYTTREETIRLIHARLANKRQRETYYGNRQA